MQQTVRWWREDGMLKSLFVGKRRNKPVVRRHLAPPIFFYTFFFFFVALLDPCPLPYSFSQPHVVMISHSPIGIVLFHIFFFRLCPFLFFLGQKFEIHSTTEHRTRTHEVAFSGQKTNEVKGSRGSSIRRWANAKKKRK